MRCMSTACRSEHGLDSTIRDLDFSPAHQDKVRMPLPVLLFHLCASQAQSSCSKTLTRFHACVHNRRLVSAAASGCRVLLQRAILVTAGVCRCWQRWPTTAPALCGHGRRGCGSAAWTSQKVRLLVRHPVWRSLLCLSHQIVSACPSTSGPAEEGLRHGAGCSLSTGSGCSVLCAGQLCILPC